MATAVAGDVAIQQHAAEGALATSVGCNRLLLGLGDDDKLLSQHCGPSGAYDCEKPRGRRQGDRHDLHGRGSGRDDWLDVRRHRHQSCSPTHALRRLRALLDCAHGHRRSPRLLELLPSSLGLLCAGPGLRSAQRHCKHPPHMGPAREHPGPLDQPRECALRDGRYKTKTKSTKCVSLHPFPPVVTAHPSDLSRAPFFCLIRHEQPASRLSSLWASSAISATV